VKTMQALLTVVLMLFLVAGCATTYVDEPPRTGFATDLAPLPKYEGPKVVVAVLPLGLSERAAKAYPHLLAKDVGLGIHNRVVDNLFDTNRFRLVEEKPEVIKDALDRQWMSSSGMVEQSTAVEMGRILGAKKVVYGEVYDYAQGGEQIMGLSARKELTTRVGIQIRCVDVETLEYIPASGVGRGRDIGEASDQAIRAAVLGLVKRMR
jgi:curli biogenesis system outer membrane secretion channel CsgG